ncbi:MAG TPA: hypothetical protein VL360_04655 [Gammaproteobacteria bacterium]|jgi:hypothetical protein|nr:hypothetical protein [Gammaproteobacteria bacterium]
MNVLKLYEMHLAPYSVVFINGELKENAANVYVYYSSEKNSLPCDQDGNILGRFMNDEMRVALENHLRTKVMPKINDVLALTIYTITNIDHTNMAPHPHLVVKRRDNRPLSDKDLQDIRNKMEIAINRINNPQQIATMFAQARQEIAAEKNDAPQTRYNLRPRR